MKRFLLKILLFTLCFVLVDRAFIVFKYKEQNLSNALSLQKLKKLSAYINSNDIRSVDVSIYGSSHPQFAVSPGIIKQETGMSCINFAYGGGTNIGAQYEFIKKVNIRTKVLVYGIDVFSLNFKAVRHDAFQLAYFNETAGLPADNEDALAYSNIFRYAHFIKRYVRDAAKGKYMLPYFRKGDSIDLAAFSRYSGYDITPDGWVKGYGLANKAEVHYAYVNFEPQPDAAAALKNIVTYCREKGIQLYIVQVPEHLAALNYKQKYIDFDAWMNKFAADNKVRYINFDQPSVFPVGNDSLFFDTDHLNAKGAELFSHQLAQAIRTSP